MTDEDLTPQRRARGRRYLLLLALWFATPVIVAALMVQNWRPEATGQHGQLLHPALPLEPLQLANSSTPLPNGRWLLLYALPTTCDEFCRQRLLQLRQLRLALGKDTDRVNTAALGHTEQQALLATWQTRSDPNLVYGTWPESLHQTFDKAFSTPANGAWFLIDPLGNLVLRYSQEVAPNGVLDDLHRLLKYSKVG